MSKPFSVDFVCICEYATQDVTGRALLAGIFPGMIGFEREPSNWPQYFIVVSVVPRSKSFEFSIKFLDEKSKNLVTFDGKYDNPSDPDEKERIMFLAQIPPVKFTGAGKHELIVLNGKHTIESRDFPVIVGSQLPMQLGSVQMSHKIGDTN